MPHRKHLLGGKKIDPPPIGPDTSLIDLIDLTFNAYNAARFREGCHLFTRRMLSGDAIVGVSLSGALSPAGLGMAAIVPLMRAGFIDWVVSTGANLYHDMHFGIGWRCGADRQTSTIGNCARKGSFGSTTSCSTTTCC